MMLIPGVTLFASLVLLYIGAEVALGASEKVGYKMGLSPLAIGMILVGMGTSLPELFVSHIAMTSDSAGIAIGNIIGSNIANTFLILGVSGLMVKMSLKDENIKVNLIFHMVLCLLIVLTFWGIKALNWVSLGQMVLFFVVYLYFIYRDMKKGKNSDITKEDVEIHPGSLKLTDRVWFQCIQILIGFGMLYYGGELLVQSGTEICQILGISDYIISVIVVSLGTSLPELVTAMVSAFKKKHTDIIVGNIIGSNIFNVAMVLGSLGIYNIQLQAGYTYEIYSLVAVGAFMLVLSFMKKSLNRFTGALFLCVYTALVMYWISNPH
jgi:cation:H+ antiporter